MFGAVDYFLALRITNTLIVVNFIHANPDFVLRLNPERPIIPNVMNESLNGSTRCDDWHHKTSRAQNVQPCPRDGELTYLGLRHVHLDREVHCERPEGEGTDEAEEVIEEGEDWRHQRG